MILYPELGCHYSLQLQLHYMCNGTITVMVIYTASAGPGGPITLHPITVTPLMFFRIITVIIIFLWYFGQSRQDILLPFVKLVANLSSSLPICQTRCQCNLSNLLPCQHLHLADFMLVRLGQPTVENRASL